MKVCHVTNFLPGYHETWGGAEQACLRLANSQVKAGLDVVVLSTTPSKKVKEDFAWYPVKTLNDFASKSIARKLVAIKKRWIPVDPVALVFALKTLSRIKPDLVHFHNFDSLSYSMLAAAKTLKIPTAWTVYDYLSFCILEVLTDPQGKPCRKFHGRQCAKCIKFGRLDALQKQLLPVRKALYDFFSKKFDAYVALSNSSKKILQEYGIPSRKIHVVPLTFLKSHKPSKLKRNYQILFVGWIEKRKGLKVLLNALPFVVKKFPKTRLFVAGTVSDKQYYRECFELISSKNLSKNVKWLGKIPHVKVQELLRLSNVVVVLEQWENMSPVFLSEAMSFGKPIVASRIGGIPDLVQD
ncbi:MAG: glycosyltransferase family 4 protein, partial [Candidatus Micrarchaeia archaeon]